MGHGTAWLIRCSMPGQTCIVSAGHERIIEGGGGVGATLTYQRSFVGGGARYRYHVTLTCWESYVPVVVGGRGSFMTGSTLAEQRHAAGRMWPAGCSLPTPALCCACPVFLPSYDSTSWRPYIFIQKWPQYPRGLLCFALLCLADIWAKLLREQWNVDFNGGSLETESLLSSVGRLAWNLMSREESFLSQCDLDADWQHFSWQQLVFAGHLHEFYMEKKNLPHNNCSQGLDWVTLETADSWWALISPSSLFLHFFLSGRQADTWGGAHRWGCHHSSGAGMHTR